MNILDKIIEQKRKEVERLKEQFTTADFENSAFFGRVGRSLSKALRETTSPGIISEFKRKSPSAGDINTTAKVQHVVKGYTTAGALGVSVLTDNEFFGGSLEDLRQARQVLEKPVLRKDFMIDEMQVLEAKANGADVILLIAECLEQKELFNLAKLAKSIDLDVLMEIHSEEQLSKVNEYVDIIGVNNRDLTTFNVSLETSKVLSTKIPNDFVKISESGISEPASIQDLWNYDFKGFLIGGHFMSQPDPVSEIQQFFNTLNSTV